MAPRGDLKAWKKFKGEKKLLTYWGKKGLRANSRRPSEVKKFPQGRA